MSLRDSGCARISKIRNISFLRSTDKVASFKMVSNMALSAANRRVEDRFRPVDPNMSGYKI